VQVRNGVRFFLASVKFFFLTHKAVAKRFDLLNAARTGPDNNIGPNKFQ